MPDFLRANDTPSRIRFVSDNARYESTTPQAGHFLNLAAGESLLRFLRGRHFNLPVLIFCGVSLPYTTYVRQFEHAGSTTSAQVVRNYALALANGKNDDEGWVRFKAEPR